MFETGPSRHWPDAPPSHAPDGTDPEVADYHLDDPVAGVMAVELSRRFVSLCMCQAEATVSQLARQEVMLRKPGGVDLAARLAAQRLYQRDHAGVFELLRLCVPLAHADTALARTEVLLRGRFGEVVRTAADYLLSHDRDTAIQMMTVATTMAARDIRDGFAEIIIDSHGCDDG